MSFGEGNLHDEVDRLKVVNGKLCDEINRQERVIERQQERIAGLERENDEVLEAWANQAATIKEQIDGLHARDELIRDLWECLSAHIESAINDGGIGYEYEPQVRGCGESCTVNGEDCSMSLMERRMRELGIEVD